MTDLRHMTLAVGSVAGVARANGWVALDLGPRHPSRAGLLLVQVDCEGRGDAEAISHAMVQPGFSHRGAEKLFEVRDYRQVLMLSDRHDWSASVHGELLVAAAAEELLGLPVPARAQLVRDALAAHARVASHLAFLEYVPWRLQRAGLVGEVSAAREAGRRLLLELTGNRVHPMVVRLGGVAADPDQPWLDAARAWAAGCASLSTTLVDLLASDDARALAAGLGVLTAADVDGFGVSGPISAASGVQRTIARPVRLPPRCGGDALSRFVALALDLEDAAGDLDAACRELASAGGPVDTPLSKIVKVPEGDVYVDRDAPMGIAGVHLVSRAATTPWRLRLRTPTFANVQALQAALVGTPLHRADVVVASLGHTIGDLDK